MGTGIFKPDRAKGWELPLQRIRNLTNGLLAAKLECYAFRLPLQQTALDGWQDMLIE
jgi:hypothetical protein